MEQHGVPAFPTNNEEDIMNENSTTEPTTYGLVGTFSDSADDTWQVIRANRAMDTFHYIVVRERDGYLSLGVSWVEIAKRNFRHMPEMWAEDSEYPYPSGEHIIIGPECFIDPKVNVICYKGENYVQQVDADALMAPEVQPQMVLVPFEEIERLIQEWKGQDPDEWADIHHKNVASAIWTAREAIVADLRALLGLEREDIGINAYSQDES